MNFTQLIADVKSLDFEEKRVQDTAYFEGVLAAQQRPDLERVLSQHLGVVVAQPKLYKRYTAKYGGISKSQLLFFGEEGEHAIAAMLWPWRNGKSMTLKISQTKRLPPLNFWQNLLAKLLP